MRISDWSSDVCSSDLFCQSAIMRATSLSCARNRARACAMTDQFQLTEDQLAIQEMARRFTADNITPFDAEWDEKHPFPSDRSEERRVGEECVSRLRSRRSP